MARNIRTSQQPQTEDTAAQAEQANTEEAQELGQSQSQSAAGSSSYSEEVAAWEAVNVDEIEPGVTLDEHGEEIAADDAAGPEFLSKEDFYQGMFKAGLHDLPAMLLRLESLPIKPEEEPSARAASDALYDTCYEIPWLHFVIKPENIYMQRLMVVVAYAGPKALSVRAELLQRKRAASQARQNRQQGAGQAQGGQQQQAEGWGPQAA